MIFKSKLNVNILNISMEQQIQPSYKNNFSGRILKKIKSSYKNYIKKPLSRIFQKKIISQSIIDKKNLNELINYCNKIGGAILIMIDTKQYIIY